MQTETENRKSGLLGEPFLSSHQQVWGSRLEADQGWEKSSSCQSPVPSSQPCPNGWYTFHLGTFLPPLCSTWPPCTLRVQFQALSTFLLQESFCANKKSLGLSQNCSHSSSIQPLKKKIHTYKNKSKCIDLLKISLYLTYHNKRYTFGKTWCACLQRSLGSYGLTEKDLREYISTQPACLLPVLVSPPDPQDLRTSRPHLSPTNLKSEVKEQCAPPTYTYQNILPHFKPSGKS